MITKAVKNVVTFLIIFTLILGINLGVLGSLNSGFDLVSFAQETGETGEAQETATSEEAVDTEETAVIEKTEEEAEAESEEELDISLIAEYIT
jgi:hypothetical protein